MLSLGQKIRELREKKGVSLREFARQIDYSAAFVSDVELGRRHPSEKVLVDIADSLGVPVQELEEYDLRLPLDDFRRKSEFDPQYAFALRKIANLSRDDLIRLVSRRQSKKPDGK